MDPEASPEERAEAGKACRARVPRSSHAEWVPPSGRPDPVELLEAEAKTRVQELLPIRRGRMLASPFAFYRGAAEVMASDLATTPTTGHQVQLCGDAHLSNFGGFAAPDRDLVFDVNDFDETLPGPWEWDVKRLGASIEIAGRGRSFDEWTRRDAVKGAVRAYRESIRELGSAGHLDLWYRRLNVRDVARRFSSGIPQKDLERFERALAKARLRTSVRALAKLTHRLNGRLRIVHDPPLLVPVEELIAVGRADEADHHVEETIDRYAATLPDDRRRLLERYRYVHSARKVVGVGSVGTRAWIILLVGRDEGDPLFLQLKEAGRSVLEPFTAPSEYAHQGRRVVEGQRLMQAAGDIFLGWVTFAGADGVDRDFYVRQLWDEKASARIDRMSPPTLAAYGRMCGQILARAHARSRDVVAIGGYLGSGEQFDRAITRFASAYADTNESDYREMEAAVEEHRLTAEVGV